MSSNADSGRVTKSLYEWLKEWVDHPDVREWPVDIEDWPQYTLPHNDS
jgi:hypothetical protein